MGRLLKSNPHFEIATIALSHQCSCTVRSGDVIPIQHLARGTHGEVVGASHSFPHQMGVVQGAPNFPLSIHIGGIRKHLKGTPPDGDSAGCPKWGGAWGFRAGCYAELTTTG